METRVMQERVRSPAPSCLSVKSDRSMGLPQNFNREGWTPELSSSLLTEDHFRCSVCSEGLREPVSIPCGHSYCRQCISTYWAQPGLAGDYVCPQCSKSFPSRPELSTNTALVRVLQALQQAGFSPVLPAVAHAGPGDVACDICCGPKLRAVKTCVTCSASYCESHVRQHYTVPALQRHTLTQVTGDQRHTHQQDSVTKTKSVEEEKEQMESETLDKPWRKKRSRDVIVEEEMKETLKENGGNKAEEKFGKGKRMRDVETENSMNENDLTKSIKVLQQMISDLLKENSELKTTCEGLQQKNSDLNLALRNCLIIFGAVEEENNESKHKSIVCTDCGKFELKHCTSDEDNTQENDVSMADDIIEKQVMEYKTKGMANSFSRLTTNPQRSTDAERDWILDTIETIISSEYPVSTLDYPLTNMDYQTNLCTPPTLERTNDKQWLIELLHNYAELQKYCKKMENRYWESVIRHTNFKVDLSPFRDLLQSYMNLLLRTSGRCLMNYSVSPFRLEFLQQWLRVKQTELQFLESLGKELQFSMMVSKQELDRYVTDAEIVSTVCFTLTSSSNKDQYLISMADYLANFKEGPAKPPIQPSTPWSASEKSRVRNKLHTFLEFMKSNEKLKFVAAAIVDESLPGASIRLYQGGGLVDADYVPVSEPGSVVVTVAEPTSLKLRLPSSRTGVTKQFTVAFRPDRTGEFFPYQEKWNYVISYSETFVLANLMRDMPYQIKHSAVDRAGKSKFSTVITGSTLLGASPGRPLIHSLDGLSVRLTWTEPALDAPVVLYNLQLMQGRGEWDTLVTTEVEKKISLTPSSAGIHSKARVCAVNVCNDISYPSEETILPLAADVILDPDTAHSCLVLSDNGRKVKQGEGRAVCTSPQRFDGRPCVLAKEGFTFGRHFWNVEVDKEWTVGVTMATAHRQGQITAYPENGYWCVDSWFYHPALNAFGKSLPRPSKLKVLGVCLDVDERWVSFYNAETRVHICTFTGMAFLKGEKIYPFFEVLQRKTKGLVIQAIK